VCIVKERIAVSRHFQSLYNRGIIGVIVFCLVRFLFIKTIILKFCKI
jgi:hypothetical protein